MHGRPCTLPQPVPRRLEAQEMPIPDCARPQPGWMFTWKIDANGIGWWCNVCEAWMQEGHLTGKKHSRRANAPHDYIDLQDVPRWHHREQRDVEAWMSDLRRCGIAPPHSFPYLPEFLPQVDPSVALEDVPPQAPPGRPPPGQKLPPPPPPLAAGQAGAAPAPAEAAMPSTVPAVPTSEAPRPANAGLAGPAHVPAGGARATGGRHACGGACASCGACCRGGNDEFNDLHPNSADKDVLLQDLQARVAFLEDRVHALMDQVGSHQAWLDAATSCGSGLAESG